MFTPHDTFPYIGLRPFSEDDSLYFKGRDEQILQLTALLEANKFLMVTGASGDGKSSLVYAGLVTNARAGFFKAAYTNWVVADFRPERTPLHNLSKSISRNLRIGNVESVDVELRRGFSSLVELYTTSSLFLDEQSEAWTSANGDERDFMQRNAANLLIVADQFEEFFTNPENYYKNAPSADSQLVINLLLETARISIHKNLPIYIVCTMRSDYIGQCAAFRGLPEFIGFSQFFVPRLKRKEIIQVVKEPAFLHGDRISNRLAERIVYDLGEGIDQLPVLEHAMNEVWIQADFGKQELDLIHYAMVGGMPSKELPKEDREKFQSWFDSLPSKLQEAYQHPGLSQIIDTHANKLYFSAADHYNQRHDKKITTLDAQLIIKAAFTCLTKMDEGRAVRNRMTLQEITDIIAKPDLTSDIVGSVLNIFREPGNTFLRPYITDRQESLQLSQETVLDITHESLIRNWELLLRWAKEEYDHLTVYEDFKKQLDRWVESGKAKGFLLPIGPLTFFESWYNELNPNQYWVNRYLDPGMDKAVRLKEAQKIIDDSLEFIRRSARRVRVTRLVVKYGAMRIAAVIGVVLILGLCGFYYRDAKKKENENVVQAILAEGAELVKGTPDYYRTMFMVISEFLRPGSFKEIADRLPFEEKASAVAALQLELTWGSVEADPSIRRQSLYYLDSIIQSAPIKEDNPVSLMRSLKALDLLVTPSAFFLRSHLDERLQQILNRSLKDIGQIVKLSLTQNFSSSALDIASINSALEYALHYKSLSKEDIQLILSHISPFEEATGRNHFFEYFPAGKFIPYSVFEEVNHSGGYQQLANLYASLGDAQKVKMCIDSLIKLHADYPTFRTNVFNIANYFITYQQEKNLQELISWYCKKQKMTRSEFFEQWLDRTGVITLTFGLQKMVGANHDPNLDLSDIVTVQKIFDLYYNVLVDEISKPDDLHFKLALYYKQRGALLSKIYEEKELVIKTQKMDSLFELALEHYKMVSPSYLSQTTEIAGRQGFFFAQLRIVRNDLFLYPDHFHKVLNNRGPFHNYFTDKFFNFLLDKGYFSSLYKTPHDVDLVNTWLSNYLELRFGGSGEVLHYGAPMEERVLLRLDSLLSNNPFATNLNNNPIQLLLINYYLEAGQSNRIEEFYKKLKPDRFIEILREKVTSANDIYYLINQVAGHLAREGRTDEVIRIARLFPNRANRVTTYSVAAKALLSAKGGQEEKVFTLLDSAISELNRIGDFEFLFNPNAGYNDPRKLLVLALSSVGGQEMHRLAGKYVEQTPIARQDGLIQHWVTGTAASGQYYLAYTAIPELTSIGAKLDYLNRILLEESERRPMDNEWQKTINKRKYVYAWEDTAYEDAGL